MRLERGCHSFAVARVLAREEDLSHPHHLDQLTTSHLRCPQCSGRLSPAHSSLQCFLCGSRFEIVSGIPLFSKNKDFYYSPVERTWLSSQLEELHPHLPITPEGLDHLLESIIDQIPDNTRKEEWIENLLDESRTSWKYLLAPQPDARILNLGCGWDNTTINLARTAGQVTAIDLTFERVRLLSLKASRCGLHNIEFVCGGDTKYLPFADGAFDMVLLNGVLEWVADDWSEVEDKYRQYGRIFRAFHYLKEICGHRNPRKVQLKFLTEVKRILKPEGEVFIGIENRTSREYFRERPDHHSFIWFGSLYPRLLAHCVSLIKNHQPYLTYTYTRRGYENLLREAKLASSKFYSIEPNYRQPKCILDLDNRTSLRQFVKSAPGKLRLLPTWLYSRTAPSFGIVAGAAGGRPSWANALVEDLAGHLGLRPGQWSLLSLTSSYKEKIILVLETTAPRTGFLVIKAPMTLRSAEGLARNHGALVLLPDLCSKSGVPELVEFLPRALYQGQFDNHAYYVESGFPGASWERPTGARSNRQILTAALTLIRDFAQLALPAGAGGDEALECQRQFAFLRSRAAKESMRCARELDRLEKELLEHIRPSQARWFRKADFSVSNIMVSHGRVVGLIDFDEWAFTSLPLADYATLIYSYSRMKHGMGWRQTVPALVRGDYHLLPGELSIAETLSRLNRGREEMAPAALLAWISHVYYAAQFDAVRYNKKRTVELLWSVLEEFAGSRRLST